MKKLQKEFEFLLALASKCEHQKTMSTTKELLRHKIAFWTSIYIEGVEPPNNAAKRVLRPTIIWKKRSFGADSESGSRFVKRILTTIYILKLQKRDPLVFVANICLITQVTNLLLFYPLILPPKQLRFYLNAIFSIFI